MRKPHVTLIGTTRVLNGHRVHRIITNSAAATASAGGRVQVVRVPAAHTPLVYHPDHVSTSCLCIEH